MDDHSRDACIALLKEKYSVLGRLPQKATLPRRKRQ